MINKKEMVNRVRAGIERLIEAGDLQGLLYKAGELHGHLCGHMAYGVNAGYIAMRELSLKSQGMEEVIAIIEDCRRDMYPEAYNLFDKIVAKREEPTPEEHERVMQLFAEGEDISGGVNEDEE